MRPATLEETARANVAPWGAKGVAPGQPVLDPAAGLAALWEASQQPGAMTTLPLAPLTNPDPTGLQSMGLDIANFARSIPNAGALFNQAATRAVVGELPAGEKPTLTDILVGRPGPGTKAVANAVTAPVRSFFSNTAAWATKPASEYKEDKAAAKAGLKLKANPPQVGNAGGFSPTGEAAGELDGILRQAAAESGAPEAYLRKFIGAESSNNPNAVNPNSSAAGLGQFIDQTWLGMIKETGAKYGMQDAADAIQKKNGVWTVSDPAAKAVILGLKKDPTTAARMTGELITRNAKTLHQNLGRPATGDELYMAHVFGPNGATMLLKAQPGLPAKNFASAQVVAANRSLFYNPDGTSKSVGQLRAKLAQSGGSGLGPGSPGAAPATGGPELLASITSAPIPGPPQEALPQPRDWSAQDALLKTLAPKPTDKKALQQEEFLNMLAGFASGLGNGSLTKNLAGVAAGTTRMAAGNAEQRRRIADQEAGDLQRYNGTVFDYENAKATDAARTESARAKTIFDNAKLEYAHQTGLAEKTQVKLGPAGTLEKTTVDPKTGAITTSIFDVGPVLTAAKNYGAQAGALGGGGAGSMKDLPTAVKNRVEAYNFALATQSDLGAFTVAADEILDSPFAADILGGDYAKMQKEAMLGAAKNGGGDKEARNMMLAQVAKAMHEKARTNPQGLRADLASAARMGLAIPRVMLNGNP